MRFGEVVMHYFIMFSIHKKYNFQYRQKMKYAQEKIISIQNRVMESRDYAFLPYLHKKLV